MNLSIHILSIVHNTVSKIVSCTRKNVLKVMYLFKNRSVCLCRRHLLCFINKLEFTCIGNGEASTELTKLKPLNKYHESKVFAEEYVKMIDCPFLIARVGWLFGENVMSDKNF